MLGQYDADDDYSAGCIFSSYFIHARHTVGRFSCRCIWRSFALVGEISSPTSLPSSCWIRFANNLCVVGRLANCNFVLHTSRRASSTFIHSFHPLHETTYCAWFGMYARQRKKKPIIHLIVIILKNKNRVSHQQTSSRLIETERLRSFHLTMFSCICFRFSRLPKPRKSKNPSKKCTKLLLTGPTLNGGCFLVEYFVLHFDVDM